MSYIDPLDAENSKELVSFFEKQDLLDKPFLFYFYCEGTFYYRYTCALGDFYEVEIISTDTGFRGQVMMGSDFVDILLTTFDFGDGEQTVEDEKDTLEITVRHYEAIDPKNTFALTWGNFED